MTDAVRLHGTVQRAQGVLRATLHVGNEKRTHARSGSFEIATDDGRRVHVNWSDATVLLPERTESGTWEKLESHAAAAPFRKGAPAPHVRVKLTYHEIRDGEPIEVEGEVISRGFDDGGAGMRTAASASIRAVTARILASGVDACALLERHHERERPTESTARRPRLPRALAAAALAALALALLLPSPIRLDLAAAALFCLAASVLAFLPHDVQFRAGSVEIDSTSFGSSARGTVVLLGCMMAAVMGFDDRPGHLREGQQVSAPHLSFLALGATLVALGIFALAYRWAFIRLVREVLRARPHGVSPEPGAWGAVTGSVRTQSGAAPAMTLLLEETFREGSTPNDETWRVEARAPFWIDTPEGVTWTVSPENATFASACPEPGDGQPSSSERKSIIARRVLRTGAPALVVGRARATDGAASMSASGPESLLIFAAPRGTEPRRELRRWLRRAGLAIAVPLVVGAALLAVGVLRPGFDPPVASPGD